MSREVSEECSRKMSEFTADIECKVGLISELQGRQPGVLGEYTLPEDSDLTCAELEGVVSTLYALDELYEVAGESVEAGSARVRQACDEGDIPGFDSILEVWEMEEQKRGRRERLREAWKGEYIERCGGD